MNRLYSLLFGGAFLSVCMMGLPTESYAVPAKPGVVEFTNPDGSVVPLYIRGDERSHYYVSTDGYPMLAGEDGYLYYATLADGMAVASDLKAVRAEQRSEAEQAWLATVDVDAVWQGLEHRKVQASKKRGMAPPQRATTFPTIGEHKALVVLVEYSDLSFTLDDPHDYFHRLLNEEGFDDYGGTGSARDYYVQNSDSLYFPQFDVFGPVTLSRPMSYYGGNDWFGNDEHPEQMVVEACQALDDEVDFSEYDADGDGKVDNVYVFYAGYGEASGGSSSTVWPHSWDLSSAGASLTLDGVRIEHYACSNERQDDSFDGIGTFCHEYGHVLGLPDIYATSYTSAFTPGAYSLMDYGSYNNNSRTPPALTAYERYELNWLDPIAIAPADTVVELPHIMDTNVAYIINVGRTGDEYFLLENRQQRGWDEYIPGHGMLVWHIDYDVYAWQSNTVNNNASHQHVDIEEADNRQSDYTQDGDPFPGADNVTMIDDDTSPSLLSWDGLRTNRRIDNITETAEGLITFDFINTGVNYVPPTPKEPVEVTPVSAMLRWEKVNQAINYEINVYRMQDDTRIDVLSNVRVGDTDSCFVVDLIPATTYYYNLRSIFANTESPVSPEYTFVTAERTFEYLAPVAHEVAEKTSTTFVASWDAMEGAEGYELEVYTKEQAEEESQAYDFTGKISGMPEGWSTTSNSCYGVAGSYGEASPSLRLNTDGMYLRTAISDKTVQELSFWYKGVSMSNADAAVTLRVLGYNRDTQIWETVEEIPVTADAATYVRTSFPYDYYATGVQVSCTGGAYAVIDDVNVLYAATTRVPLEEYDGVRTGECSVTVEGLMPSAKYYFRVRGYAGDTYSLYSNEVAVELSSGVGDMSQSDAVRVYTCDGVVYVTYNGTQPLRAALYNMQGMCVACRMLPGSGIVSIAMPAQGIYVLHAGDKTYKVVK